MIFCFTIRNLYDIFFKNYLKLLLLAVCMPCQAIKTCKYQVKQYISFEYWEKTPAFYQQQQHKLQEAITGALLCWPGHYTSGA